MSAIIEVTPNDFLTDFPEFVGKYTNGFIEGFISQSGCYVSTSNYGVLKDGCRKLAIELMTAHLLTIQTNITNGTNQANSTSSASIDKVSVTLVPPPNKNQYEFWLNLSIYGTRYLALLMAKSPVPFYYGGSPQRVLR